MGERDSGAQGEIEEKIGEMDAKSCETIPGIAIEDKDANYSADHSSGEQINEGRMKEIDTGNFKNDEDGNCNVVVGKYVDEVRCPIKNENAHSRAMITDSNGQEAEEKSDNIEVQKFEGKQLDDVDIEEVYRGAQGTNGEKVEENDRLDLKRENDDLTQEGEDEKATCVERDEGKEQGEEKTRDGGVQGELKDKDETETLRESNVKEDNEVQPLQDKDKEEEEKKDDMTILVEDEYEKEKLKVNEKKDEKDQDFTGKLKVKVDGDVEADSKEKEYKPVNNVEHHVEKVQNDVEVVVDLKEDESDLGKCLEGEKVHEVEIKAKDEDTDGKTIGNGKENEIELKAEEYADNAHLEKEKDNDEEIEERIEKNDEIKADVEAIKYDEMEVEGTDVEEKIDEIEIDNEKMGEDEPKEENDKKNINDVNVKNEILKPEGEVEITGELGKLEEKESEDEEKETEGEFLEKKIKKSEKTPKRKGKRSRTGIFGRRKMQKQGNSLGKDEDKGETDEEDDETKEKRDDEERSPSLSKKMRLTAKKSAEKNHEDDKTVKKNKSLLESADMEPLSPYIDRPRRERKTVERLVSLIVEDASRDLKIEKGRGTPLKDIPNVLHKVSRRKTDDTLKLLHTILFGKRGKALQVKNNILRFSGFVWPGDEDKQRSKVKLKFEKCNKEKLLEFCDVFDISVTKGSSKKEDIISKLVDFLINPRALATPVNVKDNQSNKRKRADKDSSSKIASCKSSSKRQKTSGSKRSKKIFESDDDDDSDNVEEEEKEKDENDDEIEGTHYEEEKEERYNSSDENSDEKYDENDESEEEYRGNRSVSKKKQFALKAKKFQLSAKKKPTKSSRKKQ